jgi:hypothetical protein
MQRGTCNDGDEGDDGGPGNSDNTLFIPGAATKCSVLVSATDANHKIGNVLGSITVA